MRHLLAPAALLLAAAAPASGPMVVAWTTWLRAAPSEQARAIDELGTGTPVEVLGCDGGWCRVRQDRAEGYMQQRTLAASLDRMQPAADKSACFPAQYYTAEGPLRMTICPAQPR